MLVEQAIIFASSTTLNDYSSKLTCHVFLVQPIFLLVKPVFFLFEAQFVSEKTIMFAIFPAFFQHFSSFSREKPPFFVQKKHQILAGEVPGAVSGVASRSSSSMRRVAAAALRRWNSSAPRCSWRDRSEMGFWWWIFIMGWLVDD